MGDLKVQCQQKDNELMTLLEENLKNNQEYEDLKVKFDQTQIEKESLESKLKLQEEELQANQFQIDQLMKNMELEKTIFIQEKEDSQQLISKLTSEKNDLELDLQDAQNQLQIEKKKNFSLLESKTYAISELTEAQKINHSMEQKLKILTIEMNEKESKLKNEHFQEKLLLNEELKGIREENMKNLTLNGQYQQRIQALMLQYQTFEKEFADLQNYMKNEMEEKRKMEQNEISYRYQIKDLGNEKKKILKESNEIQELLKQAQEELSQYKTKQETREQELIQQINLLSEQHSNLQEKFNSLEDSYQNSEKFFFFFFF